MELRLISYVMIRRIMKKRRLGRIVWGIALVIVGVIFALNVLGITEIKIFFDGWWALFIIVPSFVGLFSNRDKLGSLFGLCIGVALLLSAQGIFDFSLVWKLLIPFIIVLIGLRLIFPSSWRRGTHGRIEQLKHDKQIPVKDTAAFSGRKIDYSGQVFRGAELDAVFGSIMCDLRHAIIEEDCVITASAVFAGINIKVPDYVHVEIASETFFGGVSDKRQKTVTSDSPQDKRLTLYIEASSVFGGIDIT
jgi:predicted membrane protein